MRKKSSGPAGTPQVQSEDIRSGLSPATIARAFRDNLGYLRARFPAVATTNEFNKFLQELTIAGIVPRVSMKELKDWLAICRDPSYSLQERMAMVGSRVDLMAKDTLIE